jgi:hypothetical protein
MILVIDIDHSLNMNIPLKTNLSNLISSQYYMLPLLCEEHNAIILLSH